MPLKLSKTASNKNLKTTNFTLYKNRTENCGNETMGVALSRFSKLRHPTDFFYFFEYFAWMKLKVKSKIIFEGFFRNIKNAFFAKLRTLFVGKVTISFLYIKISSSHG